MSASAEAPRFSSPSGPASSASTICEFRTASACTLSLLGANGNTSGTARRPFIRSRVVVWHQIPRRSARTRPSCPWLELPPRLAQPGRLDFTWVSADNDAVAVGLQADTSPICGWLLPNHLDKSLGVYDAKGNALGELLTLQRSATTRELVWCPAPGNPAISPVVRPNLRPELENFHLNEIVTGLLDRDDAATAFNNFLQAIDETLWTVEPLGSRTDRHLTSLIGRPLAVTLANLQPRLAGLPYVNQRSSRRSRARLHHAARGQREPARSLLAGAPR